jgi:histidine triad (HIT) family protein
MDTIFSKIISRETPADIVYEDDLVMAFLDIMPINHGHTLVIPKIAFTNMFDGDPDTLAHMMKVGQKIGLALKEAGLATGVNLIMNNGEAAGQEVWHSHLHVVPRLENDYSFSKPKHVTVTKEDFLKTKNQLAAVLK